jgi:hypothetical protein
MQQRPNSPVHWSQTEIHRLGTQQECRVTRMVCLLLTSNAWPPPHTPLPLVQHNIHPLPYKKKPRSSYCASLPLAARRDTGA